MPAEPLSRPYRVYLGVGVLSFYSLVPVLVMLHLGHLRLGDIKFLEVFPSSS